MSDAAPPAQSRRQFLGKAALAGTGALTGCQFVKPDILVCISDDQKLIDYLRSAGDPRVLGNGDVWETYERYSPVRTFPEPPESL